MYIIFEWDKTSEFYNQSRVTPVEALKELAQFFGRLRADVPFPFFTDENDAEYNGLYKQGELQFNHMICVCQVEKEEADPSALKILRAQFIKQELSTRTVMPFAFKEAVPVSVLLSEGADLSFYCEQPRQDQTQVSLSPVAQLKQLLSEQAGDAVSQAEGGETLERRNTLIMRKSEGSDSQTEGEQPSDKSSPKLSIKRK